jgi:decaprenylphospho-beta-D-erythro-pentofuranosid-2-ulose 2-reductase
MLNKKTCLILGATSDMAVATARLFASSGYELVLFGRDISGLNTLKNELISKGVSIQISHFDILNTTDFHSIITNLEDSCYVVISFVGCLIDNVKCLEDDADALSVMNINYTYQVLMFNALIPLLKRNQGSMLIAVSSVAGDRGRQSNFVYGSAKAGISEYLSGLRMFLFPYGIHVGTIKPGFVRTKMTQGMNLPPALTSNPEAVAKAIFYAVKKKKNVVYVSWVWRHIMFIIKCIPEFAFKRLKL